MENKVSELKVNITAKMEVDRRTAETCLRLVEIFVNQSGVNVVADKLENGELRFHYEPTE